MENQPLNNQSTPNVIGSNPVATANTMDTNNKNKKIRETAIIVVLLLVIFGSILAIYLASQPQKSTNTNNSNTSTSTPTSTITDTPSITSTNTVTVTSTPVTTSTQSPNEVDTWKTYSNSTAKYSFKYPEAELPIVHTGVNPGCDGCVDEVTLSSKKYDANDIQGSVIVVLVSKDNRINTLQDYQNTFYSTADGYSNLKNTKVGTESAISYNVAAAIGPATTEYVVVKNGFYYTFRLDDSTETKKNLARNTEIFNKLLTTVRFN